MHTILKSAALAGLFTLLSASTSMAKFNCDAPGRDLQDAIDDAAIGEEIDLMGHCDEGPYFIRQDVTLTGPATLSAPNGGFSVLFVEGADANLSHLTIDATGVSTGVAFFRATGRVDDMNVEDALDRGLQIDWGSSVKVDVSRFLSNGSGIDILRSAYGDLTGNIVENNGGPGVHVSMSSSATFNGNNIDGNDIGVVVSGNAAIFLVDSDIINNTSFGLIVQSGGYVQTVSPPNTIEGNGGFDVRCGSGGIIIADVPQTSGTDDFSQDGTCIIPNPIF